MAALLFKIFHGNSTLTYLTQTIKSNTIDLKKVTFCLMSRNFSAKCKDEPYITRLALPPDYENVADFMCEAYYKYEPAIINIGLGGTEAPPVWRAMMLEQVQNGYSIIAENMDNCIIGAALNCITDVNEAKRLYTLARCCNQGTISKIIEFFGYVSECPKLWERYCVPRIFEQSSIAVEKNYQGMGIARRLVQESWFLARDCGFRLFRLDCNSCYCAQIARGFGWPLVWSIPFRQYVKNGEIVFRCVKEPHTTCQVFVDHLQCKTYCPTPKPCKTLTPPPI